MSFNETRPPDSDRDVLFLELETLRRLDVPFFGIFLLEKLIIISVDCRINPD